MELTMKTVIILVLVLIAGLVFASLILGWGGDLNMWFQAVIKPFEDLTLRK